MLNYIKNILNIKVSLSSKLIKLNKKKMLKPYTSEYSSISMKFLNLNIEEAIEELKFMKDTIENKMYRIRKIKEKDVNHSFFNNWFTDDKNNILKDYDTLWKEYLELNIWLVLWYEENNNANSPLYGTTLYIRPYILSIENITDNVVLK